MEDSRCVAHAAHEIRSHWLYLVSFAILRRKLLPNVFGIIILAWLMGRQIVRHLRPCRPQDCGDARVVANRWRCRHQDNRCRSGSREFCKETGVQLERGSRYRLEFKNGLPADWKDCGVHVQSPAGVTWRTPGLSLLQRAAFIAGVPFRRLWGAD